MFLSLHVVLRLPSAVTVCAALVGISGLDLSSQIIAPRYLNNCTVSRFLPWTEMSAVMVQLLFAIIFVFIFLPLLPWSEEDPSSCLTRMASSASFPTIPSMWSANLRLVMFFPPILTVPVWSSRRSSWSAPGGCWRVSGTEGIPDELPLRCGTTLPWYPGQALNYLLWYTAAGWF